MIVRKTAAAKMEIKAAAALCFLFFCAIVVSSKYLNIL